MTWTDAVSALATAGTFIIAGLAAWIGLRQLLEVREQRRAQSRPYVFAHLRPVPGSPKFLDLVVENVGTLPAYEIRLVFDPPPQSSLYPHSVEPRPLADYPLFKEGLPYLPPRGEFSFLFEFSVDLANRPELPRRYDVDIQYKDMGGSEFGPERCVLDMSMRWNLLHLRP